MPVVRVSIPRLAKMVGVERKRLIDRIPYVGLDIEGVDGDILRVEYSPNRPDFGTDYGIARALRGLLGVETGLPTYTAKSSGLTVSYDRRLGKVRPFIACATATGLGLDEEDVRQLISLQEDLHNGIGRKRRVLAIGLHDMDAVRPPLRYGAVPSTFRFRPLGSSKSMSVKDVLSETHEGRSYGGYFGGSALFPMIQDSEGTVLSFPPVINGDATRVTSKTKSLFVDVTGTSMEAGDDAVAILATTLAEMGGSIGTVKVLYPKGTRTTPDLSPVKIPLDLELVRSNTGLDLTRRQVVECLGRSRMGTKGDWALGPRYRVDLIHPVDVAEEVALGYGIDKIGPLYPASKQPGQFNRFEEFLDAASTVMAGSGMIELMTYELIDEKTLYSNFQRDQKDKISVQNPRTIEHSILRDSVFPSLMTSLSANVKSEYPQRLFEIGRVFARKGGRVSESWRLGCVVAHSQASFSEAKMYLESAVRVLSGMDTKTTPSSHWAFSEGRTGEVQVGNAPVGVVGEVRPGVIEAFGLRVPVSGFEVDLSVIHELLK
ncbi:MAG TPA: phenylalanine--tRNA ligase subunit beta [Nitrososphaerales archaeon]|nr:phenylalanine--tRNA ligase subunit beta [Nitrososphaerales archaeon]